MRAAAARSARRGRRRRHHRPVSAAHAPQSAGGRVRRAAPVRGVSRLRAFARLQDGVQRTAGAQFLHGGPGERRSRTAVELELRPGARFRGSADPDFSAIQPHVWLAPVALTPLLVARGARDAAGSAASCWDGPRASSTGSASATGSSSCSRSTAALGDAAGWARLPLFCVAKALHMGVFGCAGRHADAALVGRAGGGGAVGGARNRRTATLGFAWLRAGQRRHRHGAAHAPGAVHRRLRTLVRLRDDGRRAGAGRAAAPARATCSGWRRCRCWPCCRRCRPAERGQRRRPCWCSPTSRKPRSGPPRVARRDETPTW